MAKTVRPLPKPATDRAGVRVNLTLTVGTCAILDRMAAITGAGRASIIREMIEEAAPQLGQMADALEAAHAHKPADAFRHLAAAVGSAVDQGSQLQLDIKRDRRRAMRKKQK